MPHLSLITLQPYFYDVTLTTHSFWPKKPLQKNQTGLKTTIIPFLGKTWCAFKEWKLGMSSLHSRPTIVNDEKYKYDDDKFELSRVNKLKGTL